MMQQKSLNIRFNTACKREDKGTAGTKRKASIYIQTPQTKFKCTLHLLSLPTPDKLFGN